MVNPHKVRVLDPSEHRTAYDMFSRALHQPPVGDAWWEHGRHSFEPGRVFGIDVNGVLAGTVATHSSELAVPGGRSVRMATGERGGVRTDFRRRGILRALMMEGYQDALRRGEPVVGYYPSEALIYPRFGAGVATRARSIVVDATRGAFHPGAPLGGSVRLVEPDEALELVPEIYERIWRGRPGGIRRPAEWMARAKARLATSHGTYFAVHSGSDGDDGYVRYQASLDWGYDRPELHGRLDVGDLHAATPEALAGLWRFVLDMDLVTEVHARERAMDEPLEWLLLDPRACRTTVVSDELWLRLLNVEEALAARGYGDADPVVIEVKDPFLPQNDGRYRVAADNVARVDDAPDLMMPVTELASLYLGGFRPSELANAGRIVALNAGAVARADLLFAGSAVPWCGSHF
ncbi:GNAT family N-acetyltransferase [Kitasatospora sp. NBC_01266]|uniref:GNAT family N-acetyltransferase n=1 Tax=Kitasatospora sp. NBC_01266 TaxID=2903572 RepID=UPI002E34C8FA|nr:GNAT family N-acetyltransferase [Kitasatospora sp. NBC_01266]